ncbi:MAG: thiamine pyrophosphate-dependent dehydrogenase E1 component subunit alpha [Deltaproteobacteria bacterium]
MNLNETQLLEAYRKMRQIRAFEDRVHEEFATGEIPGFVHLYAGEEASAVGFCMHLSDKDRIASTHRGHGHCIAKGVEINGMMSEIYGRRNGICAGKGGSMHIADLEKGMMGANGIVGAGPPLICGAGLAAKFQKNGAVAVAFIGDGASNQGTTLESLNLASVWNLPCVFVAENNGYAEATSSKWSVSCENIADRAAAFGMPGVVVDGHDFFAVYEVAGEAIKRAREGGGPSLIECKLNRFYGHFEGDAQKYRLKEEVKNLKQNKDCLKNFADRVVDQGLLKTEQLAEIDEAVAEEIDSAVNHAKSSTKPNSADLLTDVYVSYPRENSNFQSR